MRSLPGRPHRLDHQTLNGLTRRRTRLAGLETLLAGAGIAADPAFARDAEALRGCLAEIMDTLSRLLERVRRGELATPPSGPEPAEARVGWL